MELDAATCRRARLARDRRFDGRFFVGVRTTRIFCRPVCPVQPPLERNVTYFPTAAAAAEVGLRPCLRCRPEAAPGTPAARGTGATVDRALRLIGEGALDADGVERLAERLGVGARHLRRLFVEQLGATPVAVAQTRRLLFAKRLVDETDWPFSEIAFAAGFASLRRFNAAFQGAWGRTPSELRGRRAGRTEADRAGGGELTLRLAARPPFDGAGVLGFLAMRGTPGVERVTADGRWERAIRVGPSVGFVSVAPLPGEPAVLARIRVPEATALAGVVASIRRVFDLDAEPAAVAELLGADRVLAPAVKRFPGVRIPGSWDPFELAVKAVLGQQVSVRAGVTMAGRLAERFGEPSGHPDLPFHFPAPSALAAAPVERIGIPARRAETIRRLAAAVAEGRVAFDRPVPEVVDALEAIPGIGPWTAQYVALRGLSDPDAFPAGDLVLRRAVPDLETRAESWRPWRGYAALLLWRSHA